MTAVVEPRTLEQHVAAAAVLFAFDAAFPPPGSTYKANGGIATNVYLVGNFAQGAAHVKAQRAAGIAPWPGYELQPGELISDRPTGQAAGRAGIAAAIAAGFPADGSIWFQFSVDTAVATTDYHKVRDAFLGIQDVNAGRFRISCYGQGGLISYLRAQHAIAEKGWLSASSSFPGFNPSSPDICMWQQVGNFIPGYSTDRNVITDVAALHAWWPDNSPYVGDGDMTDDASVTKIVREELQFALGYLGGHPNTRYGPGPTVGNLLPNGGVAVASGVDPIPTPAQIAAAVKANIAPPVVDVAALAKVLTPGLVSALQAQAVLTEADVETALRNVLHSA
ncbi:MAG TPA: hypothetical protein VGH54_21555 [Mycobacterium sp.]|jgi:hypothetical protein|uniref:hypothetical protein n=1 Tax=Mycobacterium sp. TaxID=1785 RepID=UPI002F409920